MKPETYAKLAFVVLLGATLAGCSTRYVQRSGDAPPAADAVQASLAPEVSYRIETAQWTPAPQCIAVLPLMAKDADLNKLELVRRGFYAHLAPKGYRLIEMSKVDDWLARQTKGAHTDRAALMRDLGRDLQCTHILEAEVLSFEKGFFAIFSKLKLGAKARLTRASDGALLWEAEHTAQLQDGGLPLSPVGAASGLFSAGRNLADEQTHRVIDDLARRLLNTLPDAKPTTGMAEAALIKPAAPDWKTDLDAWLASLPEIDREAALHEVSQRTDLTVLQREGIYTRLTRQYDKPRYWRAWAQSRLERDDAAGALELIRQTLTRAPEEPETHYLAGRTLTRLGRLDEADASLVTAIAKAGDNPEYYEALANVSLRRGLADRAHAALEKVIRLDATRPWPWYNLAVMDFNRGHYSAALDGYATAAKRYIERAQAARAEQIIQEMDSLRTHLGTQTVQARQDALRAVLTETTPAINPAINPTTKPQTH